MCAWPPHNVFRVNLDVIVHKVVAFSHTRQPPWISCPPVVSVVITHVVVVVVAVRGAGEGGQVVVALRVVRVLLG